MDDHAAAARALIATLARRGTRARAHHEKQYLRSDLTHLGVAVPVVRAAVERFVAEHPTMSRRDVLGVARALWSEPVHEARMSAVELLRTRGDVLDRRDLRLIETMLRESKTWALVDVLAAAVAGRILDEDPSAADVLDRWAADEDFWVRRSSMLALLGPLRRGAGDFKRFARYADAMLDEREFFIRKAIGWVLRETSKERPELVARWLKPRAARAAGLTIREAVKYLPRDVRADIEARAATRSPSRRAAAGGTTTGTRRRRRASA